MQYIVSRRPALLTAFLAMYLGAFSQSDFQTAVRKCDSLFQQGLNEKLIPGGTVALVIGDSSYIKSFGLKQVERNQAADTTTLFQLGSVGKLFTAIAVLQLVDEGKLDLLADVNQYLDGFAVDPPGRPITLTDLLTHTAGFNDRLIGYLARSEKEIQPLGDHLKALMPSSFQSPGTEINYSNYGYALAGHIVERVSGMSFTAYVQKNIFDRLGMRHTTYFLPDDYPQLEAYATGYRTRDTFEAVACYPRHATPAGSALSCASDMRKLLIEFLKPTGRLLNPTSFERLKQQHFTSHPDLMGYTLGMEEQFLYGAKGLAKGGAFTGFLSEFIVFPDQNLGLFISTNTQTDNFLEMFRSAFFPHLFPGHAGGGLRQPMTLDVREFAGVYRSERYNHTSVEDLLALYQGKLELKISEQGDLVTYQNGDWRHYRPVDSLTFQNQSAPEQYLVFQRDESGSIARLYTNINLAGFYLPVSLTPVAWYDDPVLINEYYVLVLVFILTFLFVPLYRLWVLIRRRKIEGYASQVLVPQAYLLPGLLVLTLIMVHFFVGFMYLARNINDFYFGVPDVFRLVQEWSYLLPVAVSLMVIATVRLWQTRRGILSFRIYYSVVCACAIIHVLFLYRWHFIGLHT